MMFTVKLHEVKDTVKQPELVNTFEAGSEQILRDYLDTIYPGDVWLYEISTPTNNMNTQMQDLVKSGQGYQFTCPLIFISAAVETDFVLFRNPAGSGKTVELFEQIVTLPDSATGIRSMIQVYKNPTVGLAGTLIPVRGLRNDQVDSEMLASYFPSISNRGTLIDIYGITYQTYPRALHLIKTVEEGDSFLITADAAANTAMTQVWAETV